MKEKSILSNNFVVIAISAVVVVGAIAFLFRGGSTPPQVQKNYDAFAQCLSAAQVTMYGSVNCVHCQNMKRLFGTSFQYMNYVECTQDPNRCEDATVDSYPTWTFADGSRLVGEQSLQILAEKTSCSLP